MQCIVGAKPSPACSFQNAGMYNVWLLGIRFSRVASVGLFPMKLIANPIIPQLYIVPSAPVIYAVVHIIIIYNQLSELNEVIVQWKEVVS